VGAWDWVNVAASFGFTLALLPQLARTLRLRRADDISRRFMGLVLVSSSLMLLLKLHEGDWVFAAAQVANILVWSLVLYFRIWPAPRREGESPT